MTTDPDIVNQIRAAVAQSGPKALASHRSAAYLWGFGPGPETLDVLVTGVGRPRPRPGIEIHRTQTLLGSDYGTRLGVPCTNPLRTLLDLGAVAPDAVAEALVQTAVSRLVTPSVARSALDRVSVRGRIGLGALRSALDSWPKGIELPDSPLEVEIGRLLSASGIDGFEHHAVLGEYEVDFAHQRRRVVLEGDGFEFHSSRTAFEADRLRDAVLAASGWLVVRLTWWQVMEDSEGVADRLRRTLEGRTYLRSRAKLLTIACQVELDSP